MGYGTQEDLPKNSLSASDLDSDTDQPYIHPRTTVVMVDDVIPSTSLLWGEEHITSDNETEAPTSTPQDTHEFGFRDRQ